MTASNRKHAGSPASELSRRQVLRQGLGVTAGTVGSLSLPAIARSNGGETLRIAMAVQGIQDPHAAGWLPGGILTGQTLGRLCVLGHDNRIGPGLAESWSTSFDLKTWTFQLREMTWHKGRPFTAEDVAWNIRRWLDPKTKSSLKGLMGSYLLDAAGEGFWADSAIEVINNHKFRLNLRIPQIAVAHHLDHYAAQIMDPEEEGRFGPMANGLGHYRLVDHQVRRRAVLEAMPGFDGIQRVEFIDLGDDPLASVAALRSGQVDGVLQSDPAHHEVLAGLDDIQLYQANTAATALVQMKVTVKPFDDPRVRKAMRLATNCQRVLQLAQRNRGLVGEHHGISPVHPDYAAMDDFPYDPDQARALLSDAGHANGIDIQIAAKPDPAWEIDAVQVMVEDWKKAGIRATIQLEPNSLFWQKWDSYPLAFVEWAHRPIGTMLAGLTLRTGAPWNATGYSDPVFDDLLDEADGILDPTSRQVVMGQLQRRLQETGPLVQPLWRSIETAWSTRVSGFRLHPQYWLFLDQLRLRA
ncbi:MAG: ABC transporter substrate-binding protein [Magnetovibrionaceae bacterium]